MTAFGIVTVNWHGFDATLHLVRQVLGNDEQDFHMVVVNNACDEAPLFDQEPTFRDPRLRVIHSPKNVGYTGGLNLGLNALLANPNISHFLLLNNDVEFDAGFLRQMLTASSDPARIYAPVILYRDSGLVQNTGGTIHLWLGGTLNANKNVPLAAMRRKQPDFLSGCVLFMQRGVVEKLGLFDENFGSYCEDLDYCLRAKNQGVGLEVLWEVSVRHFHSLSTRGNSGYKVYLLNRNQILLAKKHFSPIKRGIFILAAVLRGSLQSLLQRQFRAYLRGVKEGLSL